MKAITGSFRLYPNEEPAIEGILELTLSQDAKVAATGERVPRKVEIVLDETGSIPAGTRLFANDELSPAGTFYTVDGWHGDGGTFYRNWLKIEGPSPIDILALTPLEHAPLPVQEIVEVAPPRALPSPRKSGVNYVGFCAGTISLPATIGTAVLPGITEKLGTFTGNAGVAGVLTFTLPLKSVVSRVSILVDTPQAGNRVLVALYDASGNRVCSTSIDASESGVATREFGRDVNLAPGDYYMAWTAAIGGIRAASIGADSGQFALANAAGGAVVLGVTSITGTTLPDKLGPITPCTSFAPILACFKA